MNITAYSLALLTLGLVLASATVAEAQATNPYINQQSRPAVSPYLNLLNRDRFGISTYFTEVRPQLDAQDAIRRNQDDVQSLQRQFQNATASQAARSNFSRIGATGHPTRFFNYTHYYALRAPYSR